MPGLPGVGGAPGLAPVSAAAAAVVGGATAWRRRAPLVALGVALAAVAGEALATVPAEGLAPLVSVLLLLFSAASRLPLRTAAAALAAAVAVTGLAAGDVVFVGILHGGAWLAGRVLGERQRALAAAEERGRRLAQEAADAVAEERARIARELHDVVSHALTVVVLQAQAAQAQLGDPESAARSLDAVKQAGQEALQDMRRMLGVLRVPATTAPEPDLDRIPVLLEELRRVGLPVELEQVGERRHLPPSLALTAYRVVQEGLTNVMKHAGSAPATVRLSWEEGALSVEVRDCGPGATAPDRGGHGLAGMRERVAVVGGTLHAGPGDDGGFRLRALLPC